MPDDPLTDGLRRFKEPPILPDEKVKHEWSFLDPPGGVRAALGLPGIPIHRTLLGTEFKPDPSEFLPRKK